MKMKRFMLAAACCLALGTMAKLQTEAATERTSCITISNSIVKNYLFENFDTNHDNYLSREEVDAITSINVNGLGISSLEEIKEIPNLKTLDCRYNFLKELDLSGNPKLTSLKCSYNYLTALDVSNNTKLKTLYCANNYIQKLSLSKNTALTNLNYGGNEIAALSLKNNTAISSVLCGKNRAYIEMTANDDGTCSFDLKNLPGSFVVSRASDWSAGTLNGSVLTVPAGTKEVSYKYMLNDVNGTFSDTFTLVCVYPVIINETNFPETELREFVQKWWDDGDGILTFAELEKVNRVELNSYQKASLKGIEFFHNLISVRVSRIECDEIDLSCNPKLTSVTIYGKVGSLKMGNKIHLNLIDLWNVNPRDLDLSKMPLLTKIDVSLTGPGALALNDHLHLSEAIISGYESDSLNLTNTPKLTELSLGYGKVGSLVAGADTALRKLSVYESEVGLLDVSAASRLTSLSTYSSNSKHCSAIGQLVVGQNSTLESLNCQDSKLKSLDLSGASGLTYVNCSRNALTSLILPKGNVLKELDCSYNKLLKLDLSAYTGLEVLNCTGNELKSLNPSMLKNLTTFICNENYLRTLDVSKNTKLKTIEVQENILTGLSLNNNPDLEILKCNRNKIYSLSLSKNTKLKQLNCSHNYMTELDVSMCSELDTLNCDSTKLITICVTGCTKLRELYAYACPITEIDLSTNTALEILDVQSTKLSELNLENNLELSSLTTNSSIKGLDVRKQTKLYILNLGNCEDVLLGQKPELAILTFRYQEFICLDLSGCTALESFTMANKTNEVRLYARKNDQNQYVYDLTKHDPSFDGSRVRNLQGGTLLGNVLTTAAGVNEVNYEYDAGNGYTLLVNICFENLSMSIESQPVDIVLEEGQPGELSVKVNDGVTPTYQWQKSLDDGETWANCSSIGAKTDTMKLTGTLGMNKYTFRCVIQDVDGMEIVSNWVYCKVWGSKPVIANQTKNATEFEGDTISLMVEAYGKDLTYQWQKSSDGGKSWRNCSSTGAKTANMTMIAKKSYQEIIFRCVVKDANGKTAVSDGISIVVKNSPEVTIQPRDTEVTIGQQFRMYIQTGRNNKDSFQWMKSKDQGATWSKVSAGCGVTNVLDLTAVAGYDGMMFQCVVTDERGNTCESDLATVTILPKLISQPVDQTVMAGTEVQFAVEATGAGLTYQWKKSTDGKNWVNSGSTGAKSSTLTMTTKVSYSGLQFKCVITDKHGKTLESAPVSLTVLQPLAISKQPANVTCAVGDKATFKIAATGEGVTYQWMKSTDGGKTWVKSSSAGAATDTLSLTAKVSYNGLKFKCVVTDRTGVIESNVVTLTVK